jgi:glycosyltransferase involved in cell wall biosynthesis
MDRGGAGIAAQRWQKALGINKVVTIKDTKWMRLKLANFLLRIESTILSKFWNRSTQGPTSISLFGALPYGALRRMNGTFFVHWVQNNFISIYTLFRIRRRCIFYCHDEWNILGIGHYGLSTFFQRSLFKSIVRIKKAILNDSLLILVPTVWLKNQLLAAGIKEKRICVVPNPVADDFFCLTTLQEAELLLKHKKTKPILTFIAHSISDERKGLPLFLDAVGYISQKANNFVCFIVGSGSLNYANRSHVVTIEHVSNINILKAIYAISDCVVVPSLIDNLPQVAIEAQSSGIRVVVSNSGGTPETVLSPNISGIIVKPSNGIEFSNALIGVIDSSWSTKSRESLRDLARARWGGNSVAREFERLISNL